MNASVLFIKNNVVSWGSRALVSIESKIDQGVLKALSDNACIYKETNCYLSEY